MSAELEIGEAIRLMRAGCPVVYWRAGYSDGMGYPRWARIVRNQCGAEIFETSCYGKWSANRDGAQTIIRATWLRSMPCKFFEANPDARKSCTPNLIRQSKPRVRVKGETWEMVKDGT